MNRAEFNTHSCSKLRAFKLPVIKTSNFAFRPYIDPYITYVAPSNKIQYQIGFDKGDIIFSVNI